jgi:hypothetical protein
MPLGADVPGGAMPLTGQRGGADAIATALGLKELHPEQVRAIMVPLYVTMGTVTQSGYDTYRVPTTHDLLIEEIRAHLVPMDLTNEGGTVGNANTPGSVVIANKVILTSFLDRLIMKAANCLLDLKNTDREQKIIDNHSVGLNTLFNPAGGAPVNFGPTPQKVVAGETIRLDARFAGVSAPEQIAGNTQYGVVLVGKLIRVAKS